MKVEHGLTDKEMDILLFFALGMLRKDVAVKFMISERTLRCYLHKIYEKLGVLKLHQAVVWYFANQYNYKAGTHSLRTFERREINS